MVLSLELHKCVPQGLILGPVLFTIYINAIGQSVKKKVFNIYADGTIMYTIA